MENQFSPELQAILEEEGIVPSSGEEQPATAQPETPPDVQATIAETPAEEAEKPFDVGGAVLDVTLGVPEAIGKGAVNSVGETIEGLYAGADWVVNRFGGDLEDKEYVPYEAQTQTGKVLEPIARFVTGFVGAGKFLKLAGWANKGGKVLQTARAMVQGGLADYFSFDAHEARLSNLVNQVPALKNPVTEFLASAPKDNEAEGRFKNFVEGLGLGVAVDGLMVGLKQLKGIRLMRQTKTDTEVAQELAAQADSVDGELNTLFPQSGKGMKVETKVSGKVVKDGAEGAENLPPLVDENGKPINTFTPAIDEEKAVAYAQEVNRILNAGGDPTKINLSQFMDEGAFQSADKVEELYNTLIKAVRDSDEVITHTLSIEEAEKMFSEKISSLADITDTTKNGLTQTLLRDARSIREAGVRGVVITNLLEAMAQEAHRLAPLVRNLDPEAIRQIEQLREGAYRIVPPDALVGTELGRGLNLRGVRSTFAKDASQLLQSPELNSIELAEALMQAKNNYARTKLMQLTMDTITRVRVNAMLSGPITQMVNITSNLFKTAITPSEYLLGGLVQKGLRQEGAEQSIRQGLGLYRGMFGAFADSWRMAGSAIKNRKGVFRDGKLSQLDVFEDLSKFENVVTNGQDALKFATLKDLKESSGIIQQAIEEGDTGKLTSMVWSTGLRALGAVIDLPSTLLNGADEFFLNLNGRAMLYSELTEKGLNQGLPPGSKELSEFIETEFQKYFSNNGALIREDEIGKRVFAYATDSNFSKAMTSDTIFGKVGLALRETQKDQGGFGFAMQNVAPFVRTPVNLIEDVINHVPLVNGILNEAVRADLRAGGMRQARRIGEMVTGSMFLATATALVSQGVITGNGPVNPALRQQMIKAGWKPYSFRIPDTNAPGGYRYFELSRFEPYSTYLTVLADFAEAKHSGDRGDDKEFYSKLVASVTNNLTSKKYLTGLIDMMDLFAGASYGDLESIEKFTNDLAASFIPSAAKSIREIQDPLMRDARNFVDAMRNRTPFLSESVPVHYDFRGKPALTPILSLYTKSDMDDVDVEVLRLSQLGGVVDTITPRNRRFLSQFKNKDGKTAYERLGELMNEIGTQYDAEAFEGMTLTQYLQKVIAKDKAGNFIDPDYRDASDPFTSPEDVDGQGGRVAILRNIISAYYDAAEVRLKLEGFRDKDGRLLMAVEQERKRAKQIKTQKDLQQFQQDQSQGSIDAEVNQFLMQSGQ